MLDPGVATLVEVSAAVATRDGRRLRSALQRAIGQDAAVDEILLQSHLFVGFPDALNAIALWREVSATPAPADDDAPETWSARGARVCATVYGSNYERLRENVRALHPAMDGWMVAGGYGRVIGRAGLDLATRELCIAALLAVWNVPRQLHSHLRGALNAGAAAAEVTAALEIACGMISEERAATVRDLWRRVRDGISA